MPDDPWGFGAAPPAPAKRRGPAVPDPWADAQPPPPPQTAPEQMGLTPEEYLRRSQAAGMAAGRTPEEQQQYLQAGGFNPEAARRGGQQYALEQARAAERAKVPNPLSEDLSAENLAKTGAAVSERFARMSVPFSDVLPTTLVGKNTRAAQIAAEALRRGEATPEQIKLVAQEEHQSAIDAEMGKTLAGKIISVAGSAPKILGEMEAGGRALQYGGKALGLGKAAAPVSLSGSISPTAARAALAEPALGQAVLSHAGRMAALTPIVPSMWVEEMQQRNAAEGKPANDLSNAPPALAHAYVNMLVLGSMQKNFGLEGSAVKKALVKGGIFGAEQSTADSLYSLADRQIQGANQFNTKYGTFEHLLSGDVGEAAKEATVQAFTGALFAGLHEINSRPDKPATWRERQFEAVTKEMLDGYAKDMDSLKKAGFSAEGAARRMGDIQAEVRGLMARRQPESDAMMRSALDYDPAAESDAMMAQQLLLPGTHQKSTYAARMGDVLARVREQTRRSPADVLADVDKARLVKPDAALPEPATGEVVPRPQPGDVLPPLVTPEDVMQRGHIPPRPLSGVRPPARPEVLTDNFVGPRQSLQLRGPKPPPEPPQPPPEPPTKPPEPPAPPPASGPSGAEIAPPARSGEAGGRVRGVQFSDKVEPLSSNSAMNPAERHALTKYGNALRAEIVDAAGKPVGVATISQSGKTLHVPWLGATGKGGGEGRGKDQPFGPREVMSLAREMANAFPDAEVMTYTPSGGRIRQGETRHIDLAKLRARQAERAPEPPPAESAKPEPAPEPKIDVTPTNKLPLTAERPPESARPPEPPAPAPAPEPAPPPRPARPARPAPALTPRMAADQWRSMDMADRDNLPKDVRQQLFAAMRKGGIDPAKIKPPPESTKSVDTSPLDPQSERLIDESSLPKRRKDAIKALLGGETLRAAADRAGVSYEQLRQDAKAVLGKTPAQLVKEAAGVREAMMAEKGALFAGIPLRLGFLERLFGSGKGKDLGAFVQKWATAEGALPREVYDAAVKKDSAIQAEAQEVLYAQKDLMRAAEVKDWSVVPGPVKAHMLAALHGDTAALAKFAPPVRAALEAMRGHIDLLSQKMIDAGMLSEKMMATFKANEGVYLTRAFQVFTDPQWADKVPLEVRNRFKAWLHGEALKDGRDMTPDQLEAVTKNLLLDGTAAENPIAFIAKSKLGSKDLSILQRRKDVPEPLRALWGEVTDPVAAYAMTVGKQAHLLHNHLFLERAKRIGLDAGFFSEGEPAGENTVKLAPEGSKVMEPLNGIYTTPEIKKAFGEIYSDRNLPAYLKLYMKLIGLSKYAKTVGSPVTHLGNIIGNGGFMIGNGHWRLGNGPKAIKALRDDSPEGRAYYRRLIELGVAGDSVLGKEFKKTADDALGAKDPFEAVGVMTENSVARAVRKGFSLATKAYGAEDLVAKVYAFENEKSRYAEAFPEWSQEQVEEHAAKIVRATYPTYSEVPKAVQALRRVPGIAPFVSFSSEVVRTRWNSFRLAFAELRDPRTRAIGATRLAGGLASLAVAAAVAAAARGLTGVSRDQDEAVRQFLPDWSKDSQLLHLGRREDGSYRVIDIGRIDPHGYLTEPVVAAMRAKTAKEGVAEAADSLLKPFAAEDPATRQLLDAARNKKETAGGGEVYNPQAPPLDRAKAVAKHVGKALVPGGLEKLAEGNLPYSREVKPKEDLLRKARQFEEDKKNDEKLFRAVAAGKTPTDDEIKRARQVSEERRRMTFEDMAELAKSAQLLGLSRAEVMKVLKDGGLSAADAAAALRGDYRPDVLRPQDLKGVTPEEARRRLGLVR